MESKDKPMLVKLAQKFALAFGDWRFTPAKWLSDDVIAAGNDLTDFMANYQYTQHDGQQIEVWRQHDTSEWYIGTPQGTNIGPFSSEELAFEIASSYFSHGPAEEVADG